MLTSRELRILRRAWRNYLAAEERKAYETYAQAGRDFERRLHELNIEAGKLASIGVKL